MSETMSSPEYGPLGFLGLYHAHTGEQIPADIDDLLRIEAQDFDLGLHKRVFADQVEEIHTSAILISNRPGFVAQALVVSVRPPNNNPHADTWEVSYMTNGVASYEHWAVDDALKAIKRTVHERRGAFEDMPLAENVETLIREQVSYREAKDPTPDPLDLWGVTLLDEDQIRRNLIALSDQDPGFLVGMAGQRTGIMELGIAVVDFCARAGLDGYEEEVFARILPDEQQERLAMQMEAASPVFTDEDTGIDDELKDILGDS